MKTSPAPPNNYCIFALRILALNASLLISHSALASSVVIITDGVSPVGTADGTRSIILDLPASLEFELSTNLPPDPAKAQSIIQQRLTPDLTARMTKAHQDVADAWSMGVTKIPAVVVDQKYVVYGETNVQRALDRIQAYREANP